MTGEEEWKVEYRKANDKWYHGLEPKYQELCNLIKEQTGISFEVSCDSEWYSEMHIEPVDREDFEGKEPKPEDFCPGHVPVKSRTTEIVRDGKRQPLIVCELCGGYLN